VAWVSKELTEDVTSPDLIHRAALAYCHWMVTDREISQILTAGRLAVSAGKAKLLCVYFAGALKRILAEKQIELGVCRTKKQISQGVGIMQNAECRVQNEMQNAECRVQNENPSGGVVPTDNQTRIDYGNPDLPGQSHLCFEWPERSQGQSRSELPTSPSKISQKSEGGVVSGSLGANLSKIGVVLEKTFDFDNNHDTLSPKTPSRYEPTNHPESPSHSIPTQNAECRMQNDGGGHGVTALPSALPKFGPALEKEQRDKRIAEQLAQRKEMELAKLVSREEYLTKVLDGTYTPMFGPQIPRPKPTREDADPMEKELAEVRRRLQQIKMQNAECRVQNGDGGHGVTALPVTELRQPGATTKEAAVPAERNDSDVRPADDLAEGGENVSHRGTEITERPADDLADRINAEWREKEFVRLAKKAGISVAEYKRLAGMQNAECRVQNKMQNAECKMQNDGADFLGQLAAGFREAEQNDEPVVFRFDWSKPVPSHSEKVKAGKRKAAEKKKERTAEEQAKIDKKNAKGLATYRANRKK
jgi:hypothetical protein